MRKSRKASDGSGRTFLRTRKDSSVAFRRTNRGTRDRELDTVFSHDGVNARTEAHLEQRHASLHPKLNVREGQGRVHSLNQSIEG